MESIGIGTLAKHAGLRVDMVRYYERSGLLAPKARLASGYRRYGRVEVLRLALSQTRASTGLRLERGAGFAFVVPASPSRR